MDEGSLEAAIQTYSAQLQQVENALSAGLDASDQSDLLRLKEDLRQLIELTQSSLLSVRKSQLLASLEGVDLHAQISAGEAAQTRTQEGGLDEEYAAFYSEVAGFSGANGAPLNSDQLSAPEAQEDEEGGDDDNDYEEEEEDALSGTRVRAPYRTSWGTLEYHNAMVVGTEPPDGDSVEAQVRVLYIHPTHRSMKPCPFFLEDKCRFMDNCRFSHGEVVCASELRDFLETDISNLQEGSSCLAKHEDGIWYPAKITELSNGYYTIKFDSLLLKEAVVEADCIIPPMRQDDIPSSESDSDDTGEEFEAYAKVVDSRTEAEWNPASSTQFGAWEVHTRGIGSKLMLKMGYEFGKGLGKSLEGRVEPVQAVVLPKGNSLDQCAELTVRKTQQAIASSQPGGKKKAKRKRISTAGGRPTVFDFLNDKLGDCKATAVTALVQRKPGEDAYRGCKTTKRSLNVQLFQATERVMQTEREIKQITESLARRNGRDAAMISHLEEKLTSAQKRLTQLKAQERSIQREQRKADTHKKMTEF
ncbi:zinc finger CCCH-type with G patch domain-containing protein-like [Denticeps clupeoides]|uniref:Zinc finger CCCH-type with G patch domain-containing protein n=1 Tax=Denticeps clupeoides TaxID=299321 RepID=A0A8C4B6J6_9TELE|nr:zinc finger CCCH-type with G patch domain-containing protein-like [Denticeps clupeoides]